MLEKDIRILCTALSLGLSYNNIEKTVDKAKYLSSFQARHLCTSKNKNYRTLNQDFYGYIAYQDSYRLKQIYSLIITLNGIVTEKQNEEKVKVLDLGCGFSHLINAFTGQPNNIIVNGIEYQKDIVNYMNNYYTGLNLVTQGDLTKLSKKCIQLISNADILYSYVPISNVDIYIEAYEFIISKMKKGALLIEVGASNNTWYRENKLLERTKLSYMFIKK